MSANKRNLLVGGLMLVALLVFLDPFQLLTPKPTPARRDFTEDELASQGARFAQDAQPAAQAVLALFADHRVVLVGGHFLASEHLGFFAELAKSLGGTTVRQVGSELLLASDQADIDRLINGPDWDEDLGRRLLFDWQTLCGYQENLDILKAVWQANHDRPAGTPAIRLLGLNVAQDTSAVHQSSDLDKPEVMKQLFSRGVPDSFMANQVLNALADPAGGGKILVLTQFASALSSWPDDNYSAEMAKRGLPGQRRMGNLLNDSLAVAGKNSPVASVLLSGPWAYHQSRTGTAWPVDGLVDRLIENLAAKKPPVALQYPLAWNLATAALGETRCRLNDYLATPAQAATTSPAGKTNQSAIPRLRDMADLLVVFGPVRSLHPVTPIKDFIHAGNLAAALKALPGIGDPGSVKAAELNESIRKVSQDMQSQFDTFR